MGAHATDRDLLETRKYQSATLCFAMRGLLRVEDPTLELHQRDLGRPEQLLEIIRRDLGLEHVTAGEDVHGGVPVLRPCMNREVRLGNDDDSAHAVGTEFVKHGVDDRGAGPTGRFEHGGFHDLKAADGFRIAVEEIQQQVLPERLQALDLSDTRTCAGNGARGLSLSRGRSMAA